MSNIMKVKDLIEELKTLNPEACVVLAEDSEGNAFSVMPKDVSVEAGLVVPKLGSQEDYFTEADFATSEVITTFCSGITVEKQDLADAVILWPSN